MYGQKNIKLSHIHWQTNTSLSAELVTFIYGDKRRNKNDRERLCVWKAMGVYFG